MRIFLYLAIILVAYISWKWIVKQPASVRWRYAGILAGVALIALVATGRLPWLFAVIGALIPVARRLMGLVNMLPIFHQLYSKFQSSDYSASASQKNDSTVQTDFIRMTLDHDSGEMSGTVLKGDYAGKGLNELNINQLTHLFEQCLAVDSESASLLNAYLDRVHGEEWHNRKASKEAPQNHSSGNMTQTEAYEILGLTEEADRKEIIAAHRRLIQKLHPDRGGSAYLATKLNQAKKLLLET